MGLIIFSAQPYILNSLCRCVWALLSLGSDLYCTRFTCSTYVHILCVVWCNRAQKKIWSHREHFLYPSPFVSYSFSSSSLLCVFKKVFLAINKISTTDISLTFRCFRWKLNWTTLINTHTHTCILHLTTVETVFGHKEHD